MSKYRIGIIGLGNVGLDLALNFSQKYYTFGYDKDEVLIENIKIQKKKYLINSNRLKIGLKVSSDYKLLVNCNFYIITVPTPIDEKKLPNLKSIIDVTKLISRYINKENIIVYESTFYPGLTEEICIPLIEKISRLKLNEDFYVGYSPERINIGDNKKMSNDIIKITSGSNTKASRLIDNVYKSVINAGTYSVQSIKVAEAVKILENCQRDINIAFMNEISMYFNKIGININDVVKAASTKWNFCKYLPGLVGGDCIAVDPYYLIHSGRNNKFNFPLISLARKTNEEMLNYVYKNIIVKLTNYKIKTIAFLGISYKANCNQINNSMYLKLAKKLDEIYYVDIYDHLVEKIDTNHNLTKIQNLKNRKYDAIIIGAGHKKYKKMNFKHYLNSCSIFIDINANNLFSEDNVQ